MYFCVHMIGCVGQQIQEINLATLPICADWSTNLWHYILIKNILIYFNLFAAETLSTLIHDGYFKICRVIP